MTTNITAVNVRRLAGARMIITMRGFGSVYTLVHMVVVEQI